MLVCLYMEEGLCVWFSYLNVVVSSFQETDGNLNALLEDLVVLGAHDEVSEETCAPLLVQATLYNCHSIPVPLPLHCYTYIHTHTWIHTHARTHTHTHTQPDTHTQTYTHTQAHTDMHRETHTQTHTYLMQSQTSKNTIDLKDRSGGNGCEMLSSLFLTYLPFPAQQFPPCCCFSCCCC